MKITKGQVLKIKHARKGNITVIANQDFDSETEIFYPVSTVEAIDGINTESKWLAGGVIPCKGSMCTIKSIEEA